jgi:hypothetical protein
MKDFPSCNKACAICNEPRKLGGRLFCQIAYDALHENGIPIVGLNVFEFDGIKYVEVQPWSEWAKNCADFNMNENNAKEYIADGESPYMEGIFDWYFERTNYTR